MILGQVQLFYKFNPIEMEIILFHVEKKKLVNILVFELYLFDRLIVLLINNSTVIFSGRTCRSRTRGSFLN